MFPATYEMVSGASAGDLVKRQLDAYEENVAKVPMKTAKARNLTRYDVLIIASMVEREAQLARERPLIAAVIHNRLKEGIPLGIDATIRYDIDNWSRPLRVSELERDTPYNTRTRRGLPPTPIGNPGLASIKAAAEPGQGQVPVLRAQARQVRRARVLEDQRPVRARRGALPGLPRRSLTTYLGVCGWPVAHSRSPAMQNAGLQAVGLSDWQYLALPLPPELFAETVRALPAAGFRGVNVTIPHKQAALALADEASPAARAIGAANTLTFERRRDRRRQHRRAGPDRASCAAFSTPPGAARWCSARAARRAPRCGRSCRPAPTSRCGTARPRGPRRSPSSSVRATPWIPAAPKSWSTRRQSGS